MTKLMALGRILASTKEKCHINFQLERMETIIKTNLVLFFKKSIDSVDKFATVRILNS